VSEPEPESPEVDPLAPMILFCDTLSKSLAGAMSEVVSSKGFVDLASKQMEAGLEATGALRQRAAELMEEYLHQVSLPSRQEVAGLASRLTNIEMRLDDLDAKLDEAMDDVKALRRALLKNE